MRGLNQSARSHVSLRVSASSVYLIFLKYDLVFFSYCYFRNSEAQISVVGCIVKI